MERPWFWMVTRGSIYLATETRRTAPLRKILAALLDVTCLTEAAEAVDSGKKNRKRMTSRDERKARRSPSCVFTHTHTQS